MIRNLVKYTLGILANQFRIFALIIYQNTQTLFNL